MKEWESYKAALVFHLHHEDIAEPHTIDRVVTAIQRYFDSHLPCAYCNKILPDEAFYRGAVNTSRRGLSTICKICTPRYRSGKPFTKEAK